MKKIIPLLLAITLLCCNKDQLNQQTSDVILISIIPDTNGISCTAGGFVVETGRDLNDNGILDSNEVESSELVCEDADVSNSLICIIEEPAGNNCPEGGFRIDTGNDENENGMLDLNEISSRNFVCNAAVEGDEVSSLVNIVEEPVGINCLQGGFKIESGIDENENGMLDLSEIQLTNYVCDTSDGDEMQSSLINIVEEPTGENCLNGGFKIDAGIDENNNGILDLVEIQSTNYICNQELDNPLSNNIETDFNIEGILTYGQSLALGGGASHFFEDFENSLAFIGGNFITSDTDLSSFVEVEDATNIVYAPVMASTLAALKLIDSENEVDINELDYQYLPLSGGITGGAISDMDKGTVHYQNVMNAISSAKNLADQAGKTFAWRVVNLVQGESNSGDTKQEYYDQVNLFFDDFNADVKAITGQTEDVIFIIHQTSPWLGRILFFNTPHPHMNVQEAQLQLALDKSNVFIDGGSYQFAYNDIFHPVDRATVGLKQGVALKRILNDNADWPTFYPISHQIIFDGTQYYIHLKFDVPVKPLRFDISGDDFHNPNGKQTNFGFQVLDNDIEQQTAEPYITFEDVVVLTTNTNPIGMTIRYAANGHDGGGNLCDSQNITIMNKGIEYVLDNFAVGFSEYVID